MDRDETLDLLRDQHDFPGPFDYRVVVEPSLREVVLGAVREALCGQCHLEELSEVASSKGTYVSLRLRAHVQSAEQVLDVYAALKGVEGIKAVL